MTGHFKHARAVQLAGLQNVQKTTTQWHGQLQFDPGGLSPHWRQQQSACLRLDGVEVCEGGVQLLKLRVPAAGRL
jgi:hypothetical protein